MRKRPINAAFSKMPLYKPKRNHMPLKAITSDLSWRTVHHALTGVQTGQQSFTDRDRGWSGAWYSTVDVEVL
jgi:hypothetical protein